MFKFLSKPVQKTDSQSIEQFYSQYESSDHNAEFREIYNFTINLINTRIEDFQKVTITFPDDNDNKDDDKQVYGYQICGDNYCIKLYQRYEYCRWTYVLNLVNRTNKQIVWSKKSFDEARYKYSPGDISYLLNILNNYFSYKLNTEKSIILKDKLNNF